MPKKNGVPNPDGSAAPSLVRDNTDQVLQCLTLAECDFELDEGSAEKPKREVVMTALREGPGNSKDKRWYERSCVEGLENLVYSRRKLFINHLKEGAPPASDDLRDWAATIIHTKVVEGDQGAERKVRFKVHDDWLWERFKDPVARKEIALSIEGRGAGRMGKKGEDEYTCIEKIYWLNAFKFVPYPGNATMGADLVEGSPSIATSNEEDPTMDLTKVTLEEVEKARPDLIEAVANRVKAKLAESAAAPVAAEGLVAKLREEFTAKFNDTVKNMNGTIKNLEEKLGDAERKLDGAEIREKMARKEVAIDKYLKEAALPSEALTPRFLARLKSVVEREVTDDKGVKKISTVEEQIQAEVEEQKRLVTPALGGPKKDGVVAEAAKEKEAVSGPLTEDEKQFLFDKQVLGLEEYDGMSLLQYRAKRDKKAEPAKETK